MTRKINDRLFCIILILGRLSCVTSTAAKFAVSSRAAANMAAVPLLSLLLISSASAIVLSIASAFAVSSRAVLVFAVAARVEL